jgi:rare lipoprotein A
VKNIHNGKSVKVRINDRGPFVKGRIIDLTRGAFSTIANLDKGVVKVEITVVK